MLSEKDIQAFACAQEWFKGGEIPGSLIIFEALWKKHPHNFSILLAFGDALEQLHPIKALDFYSDILAGEGAWLKFLQTISDADRALLFERHGLLAFILKDELSALDSLRRAASIGLDTLNMWAALALLFSVHREPQLAFKALVRMAALYQEPTFFSQSKRYEGFTVDDNLFWTISLTLAPQLCKKDAVKVCSLLQLSFENCTWMSEIQRIVAQLTEDLPIKGTGETYVGVNS